MVYVGWHDWHGWRAAESRAIKWIAVQCCSWALQRVKVQFMHADVILKRKFTPLQSRSCSYFIPLKRAFFCHWKPMAACQPLHVFATQQQFLWTSSSRCCQFFTFLSFYCLCLHGSLHVCSACRREGQRGRGRVRRGSASQLHNMGDLQSPILWPFGLVGSSTSWLESNCLFPFSFFFILFWSDFFKKKIGLSHNDAWGLEISTTIQRNLNYICVCAYVHVCNGMWALAVEKQLLKWLIRQMA